jgi:methyl-accepting chemotaxis protein
MQILNRLKIGKKIALGFIAVSIITVIVGVTGYYYLAGMKSTFKDMYLRVTLPLKELEAISRNFQETRIACVDMIKLNDLDLVNQKVESAKECMRKMDENANALEQHFQSKEGRILYKKFSENKEKFRADVSIIEEMALSNRDEEAQAVIENGSLKASTAQALKSIEEMVDFKVQRGLQFSEANDKLSETAFLIMTILIIVGAMIAIGFGLFISNIIKKPVQKVLTMAYELQKGHIKARAGVDSEDEIGEMAKALDQFAKKLDEDICGALYKIADGNVEFTTNIADQEDRITPALNKLASNVRELIIETNKLTHSAIEGELTVRGDASKFSGGYKNIVEGINETMDAVIHPVKEGSDVLKTMASGDLSVRMTGDYKGDYRIIKDSINLLGESMTEALSEVGEAVHATASAASQISSSSEEMAAGAQEQTAQATEIASAVEQMTKTILESAQSITQAAQFSKQASLAAKNGTVSVENTKQGMNKISEGALETANIISSLSKRTEQIGEITQVIDDIADQTNLLALNAAIEAARAGEQGRGFAVVADEVRKLAERTTKATKEIAETIKDIQIEVRKAVSSMDQSNSAVDNGIILTGEVDHVLNEILLGATKVSDVIDQVAAASEQQSTTAEEISKNIEGITSVTQQSAAGTQQIARAAEDLSRLTVNLQDLIGRFKLSELENRKLSGHDATKATRKKLFA